MKRRAVIFSQSDSRDEGIFSLINPLKLYDEIRTCTDISELADLLEGFHSAGIFSSADPSSPEEPETIAELENLATRHGCFLCFFTTAEPQDLFEQGLLPIGSYCLNYQTPPTQLRIELASATARDNSPESAAPPVLKWRPPKPLSRFAFDRFLSQELSRSDLTGRPFALLLIEPGPLPDSATHPNPPETMMQLAIQAVASEIRTSDIFCRYQNHRLALILPETSTEMAERAIDRIRSRLARLFAHDTIEWTFQQIPPGAIRTSERAGGFEQILKTAAPLSGC